MSENLATLLKTVVDRTPWPDEQTYQQVLDTLRKVETDLSVEHSVVGPPPGSWEDEDGISRLPSERPGAGVPVAVAPNLIEVARQAAEAAIAEMKAQGWQPPAVGSFAPPQSPEPIASPETDNAFAKAGSATATA